MPKRSCFRTPFGCQCVHRSQTLLKHARQHFSRNFLLMSDKWSWKKSLLVRSDILGLCFNTLTAYLMYSRENSEKFPQQIPMELSSKP